MIKPRKAVQEMKAYDPPTGGRKGKLRLDFNENTVGCSTRVIEILKTIRNEDLSVYPEYSKLIRKLAKYLKLKTNQVLATNATDEAIKLVLDTYIEKGEEVIIPVPTFAMFKFYLQLADAKIVEVLYNKDLSFSAENVLNKINKKTKMVVLVNPNNPTGSAIDEQDIIKIIEKARKTKALVLIDEAYYQFYGKTSKDLVNKYDNLIVLQTFSKAFGLAGIRLGYIISCEENIKNLEKASSPYSVNSIAVMCGIAALEDIDYVEDYAKEVNKSKQILESELKRLKIKTYPSSANFLIANFGEKCDYVYDKLKENGILVRNRDKYPLLKGCLRLGIGTQKQTKQLIDEIKEILSTILFDMDGVLVDVSKSYRVAIKKTAEFFLGKEVSFQEIQSFKNNPNCNNDWDLTEAIIKDKGKSVDKNKIIDKFQEYYLGGLIDNEMWLLDKRTLAELKSKYRVGIITGRPRKEAEYVLKRNSVEFDFVLCMEDFEDKSKILNEIKSDKTYYFGDTVYDMISASKAGVIGVGVLPPQDKSQKLKNVLIQNRALAVIDDINKIMEVL